MKTNHHYSSLLYKYKKFKLRLDRVMKNGSFARYTYRKRCMLLKRLDRLRRQLEQLSSKWKLAGTGAMALGAMAFAAPEAEAQGLFSSDTFVVNSHTLHDQKNPAIAMDADGDFVVVWQSKYQDDDDYGVYAQRYTSDGNREGEEFKVNTYTTSNQMNPAVAMNADGDFVVVWESYGQDADGYGVYARLYTSDGSAEEEEFIINAWTKGHQRDPAVAMDADGAFVVVWESINQTNGNDVYARLYTSDGNAEEEEFIINTWTKGHQTDPDVAMDADGDFIVVWTEGTTDDEDNWLGIIARRYDNTGATVDDGELVVNTYTTGDQEMPAIALDADGNFVVVWQSDDQDSDGLGIFAQRYNNSGEKVETEFQVNTYTTYDQETPDVAMDADGDFVIVWRDYGTSPMNSKPPKMYMQRYDNAGDPNGDNLVVEPTLYHRIWAAVAMDATGDFVIVSDAQEEEYGDDEYEIYAQHFILSVAPTALALDNNSINENKAVGTAVGSFSSTDANATDTHTYSLVSGAGGTDNNSFSIEGDELQTGASFDYETQSSYSIRVRTTDSKDLYTEDTFTISVNALSDNDPVLEAIGDQTVDVDDELTFTASAKDADQPAETLTYSIDADSEESGMSIDSSSGAFSWTPTEDQVGTHTATVTVSDGTASDSEEITITVNNVLGLEYFNHQSNIYPSPSSDIVHLEMENSYRGLVKIRILDISGKLIQKEQQMKAGQILKVPITLENLKSGVHMVEISIGDQRVVKRIIKN